MGAHEIAKEIIHNAKLLYMDGIQYATKQEYDGLVERSSRAIDQYANELVQMEIQEMEERSCL